MSLEMENTTLKKELRTLMITYSAKELYGAVEELFSEDYNFYRSLYESQKEVKPSAKQKEKPAAKEQTEVPADSALESLEETGLPKIRADTKIKIVKKAIKEEPLTQPQEVAKAPQPQPLQEESKYRDPKDIKKWQKEQEDLKHAQLLAAGTEPKSLLTLENLKKWIEKEARTYAFVAREYVGLPEVVVSQAAKELGVQSTVAKRRAIIAKKKKV